MTETPGAALSSAVSHVLPVRLLLSTSSGIGGGATTVLAIAASTSALVCGAILEDPLLTLNTQALELNSFPHHCGCELDTAFRTALRR